MNRAKSLQKKGGDISKTSSFSSFERTLGGSAPRGVGGRGDVTRNRGDR